VLDTPASVLDTRVSVLETPAETQAAANRHPQGRRGAPSLFSGLVFENNYFTEMCSGSEAGSYLRLIDFVYHSTLGLRVIKKKKFGVSGVGCRAFFKPCGVWQAVLRCSENIDTPEGGALLRNQNPETRQPEPEIRAQKPETRNQRAKSQNSKPKFRNPKLWPRLKRKYFTSLSRPTHPETHS